MKKILSFLAVAIMATTAAQAASVTWGSGSMKTAKDATGAWDTTSAKKAVTAVYLIVDQTTYNSYAGKAENIYKDWSTLTGKATRSSGAITSNNGGQANWTDTVGVTGTDTIYALALYTYSDATYGDFYIAAAGNAHLNDLNEVEGATANFASNVGKWTPATAVPEPTTVALLALGLAAVGLKRKVA